MTDFVLSFIRVPPPHSLSQADHEFQGAQIQSTAWLSSRQNVKIYYTSFHFIGCFNWLMILSIFLSLKVNDTWTWFCIAFFCLRWFSITAFSTVLSGHWDSSWSSHFPSTTRLWTFGPITERRPLTIWYDIIIMISNLMQ